MRLHRLIAILMLLESRQQIKARELAEALETSERTIHRDIAALNEAGIPIMATAGPTGGFRLMPGYSVKSHALHGEDIVNLYLSGIGVRPESHSEASIRLTEAILRLKSSLPSECLPDVEKARSRFCFDPTPWWRQQPELKYMDILRRAVWDSRKLQLMYMRSSIGRNETSIRIVRPYGLVVKSTDWYLVGWCEERQGLRVFRCDRILEAVLQEETFAFPADFCLDEIWQDWVAQFMEVAE